MTRVTRPSNTAVISVRAAHARRALTSTAVAGVTILSLTACQWTSTIQTDRAYVPADGAQAQLGDVALRNVLVISGKAGGPATLVGYASNAGTADVKISVSAGADGTPVIVTVPASGTAQLSGSGSTKTTLTKVAEAPGAITTLVISTPSGGSTSLAVPVLYPSSPYESLAPAGFTPTPTPKESPSSSAE